MTEPRLYLVAYDISSPRRWRRVVKAVRRVGERRQLSVFMCRMTRKRRDRLEAELTRILHPEEDRLMILDFGPAPASGADHLEPLVL